MACILNIETSTNVCSAALSVDGNVVWEKASYEGHSHAALLGVYVEEALREMKAKGGKLEAVAVSSGPGSYTGLRIGVSLAKGLCFGGKLPLLAAGTLDVLVWQAIDRHLLPEGCKFIVPMIDARRMEAYTAVFSAEGRQITETKPEIFVPESFGQYLSEGKVLFIGDAAKKCSDVVRNDNAVFCQCFPEASAMLTPALTEYKEKRLQDVAYFEPFYLKEFVATASRKKIF